MVTVSRRVFLLASINARMNRLPHIKDKIDAARAKYGQYLLTGSQNLLLIEHVTESWACSEKFVLDLPGNPGIILPF